jgi:ubiquinone biosynthesis protein
MHVTATKIHLSAPSRRKVRTWKFATKFLWKNATTSNKAELGRWTKEQLVDLGPTFMKVGQFISTRGDLYPPEFVKELESLQDDVPPVEVDTSLLPTHMFSYFDQTPFKSATIGQVHMAHLLDGTKVVVKVKRPHIYDIMKEDTDTIKEIVSFLEAVGLDTGTGNGFVLDEAIENLLTETDYVHELQNGVRFGECFKDCPWIQIPKMFPEMSNQNLIVMEYVSSEKLTDIHAKGVNKKKVCEALIRSYVEQTMSHGFFHADPHPGNVGFNGKLVFYDFGLMIPISPELRDGFMELLVYIVSRDTKAIVETLTRLKVIIPTTDATELEIFFESILGYMEKLDLSNFTNELMEDELMLSLAKEKPFIIPSSFIYLAKTFSTVEGLCLKLDPEFNYFTYLEPLITSNVTGSVDVRSMLMTTAEMPTRIKNISTAVLSLEKSRAAVKRSLKKTRREIRFAQYSILCAMIATEQENEYLFGLFAFLATWFTFSSRKSQ